MAASLCECFEPQAGLGKQFLSHRQVALRPGKAFMAEKRRQFGQKIIQVRTAAIPCSDAVNGRRMPEIVQTRLVTGAAIPPDARDLAQPSKCGVDNGVTKGCTVTLAKQPALGMYRMPLPALSKKPS